MFLSAALDEQVLPPDGGGSAVNEHRLVTGSVARMKGTHVKVSRRVVNGRFGHSDANEEITEIIYEETNVARETTIRYHARE